MNSLPRMRHDLFKTVSGYILGTDPKRRFIKFVVLVAIGGITGYLYFRRGFRLTPETFKHFVLSLGIFGPILYTAVFIIRPLFLIPSITLFIAGGLAFGPIMGPLYASLGAALGGAVGFWISRLMGHAYVMSRLKFGAGVIDTSRFSFSRERCGLTVRNGGGSP